jgi:CBS domain-containing protein
MIMRSRLAAILEKKGREVHSIDPEVTVSEAVKAMNDHHIGALLVVAGGRPAGMFTERDVLVRVVAADRDPATTSVAEVMTRDLLVVGSETTVEEAMAVCTQKRCRHLPVMEGDEVLGMISNGDLSRWVSESQGTEIKELVRYIRGEYGG